MIGAESTDEIPDDIREALYDFKFTIDVKEYLRTFSPLWNLLKELSNKPSHYAAEQWLKMTCESSDYVHKFELAKAKCLNNTVLMAYFLNPNHNGQLLKEYGSAISEFAEEFDAASLKEYLAYKRNDPAIKKCKAKNLDPLTFWEFLEKKFQGLSKIASQLLELPSSAYQWDFSLTHQYFDLDFDKIMTIKFDMK